MQKADIFEVLLGSSLDKSPLRGLSFQGAVLNIGPRPQKKGTYLIVFSVRGRWGLVARASGFPGGVECRNQSGLSRE